MTAGLVFSQFDIAFFLFIFLVSQTTCPNPDVFYMFHILHVPPLNCTHDEAD